MNFLNTTYGYGNDQITGATILWIAVGIIAVAAYVVILNFKTKKPRSNENDYDTI